MGNLYLVYYAIIMAVLAIAPIPAHSEYAVVMHGISWHDKRDYSLNESNPGLGVRYGYGALSAQIGRYKNSYFTHSNYALIQYLPYNVAKIKTGLFAALATGYDCQGYEIAPAIGAAARYSLRPVDLTVRWIPADKANNSSITSIEAAYNF